jgi:hypothetical protein
MDSAGKGLRGLIADQKLMGRMSYRMLFAGAAFLAFGVMAGRALASVIENTERGAMLMDDFSTSIGRVKKAFSEAMIEKYGEKLEGLLYWVDQLAANDKIINIAVDISISVVEFTAKIGMGLIGGALLAYVMKIVGAGLLSMVGTGMLGTGYLALGGTALGTLALGAGAAILQIAIPVGITLLLAKIIWDMALSEDQKESILGIYDRINDVLQEGKDRVSFLPRTHNPYIEISRGSAGALMNWLEGGGEVNINNETTIENINTEMDEEELEQGINDILSDSWMRMFGCSGNLQ